ncbi:hypothetical protein [Candidatus Nanohalococcus occultus]|uniref:hypothetical protein n=1 Tax=Candidatus Nanohalococcus occultus TaxID=2978047 RepID=UPI0039E16657
MISRDFVIALALGIIIVLAVIGVITVTERRADSQIGKQTDSLSEDAECIFEEQGLENAAECTDYTENRLRTHAT